MLRRRVVWHLRPLTSGRSLRYETPRWMSWLCASSKCPYTIFSERDRGRLRLQACNER